MELRRAGIATEVYPAPRKLGEQLRYADRRGFPLALIIGDSEWEAATCQVKELAHKQSQVIPQADLVARLGEMLRSRE
jgi:histidyl-tRNA synthetase